MKFLIKVGTPVFLEPCGNQVRISSEIKKHVVKRVGRKYFETWDGEKEYTTVKFHIDTLRQVSDYPSWVVHQTEQEILDRRECARLMKFLRNDVFDLYKGVKLTLDQLKRMEAIALEAIALEGVQKS